MTAIDTGTIAANLERVRAQIAQAAERAGRAPAAVQLVGVSKTFPAPAVIAAAQAGLNDVGENRVQEAAAKQPEVAAAGIEPVWHLIGHLQTNKVDQALAFFSVIHSVDSLRLAQALSRKARPPLGILIEVNVAGEASKTGFALDEAVAAAEQIAKLPNLDLRGLMTVAPLVADPNDVRPVFRRLREMRDTLGLRELSMGMSADYAVAIEEGATIVRIGRAIFGERG